MTSTVPDGPDTELAAAIEWVRGCDLAPGDLDAWMRESRRARGYIETIVRAVLARPAAGRDLTDVEDGPLHFPVGEMLADELAARNIPPRMLARPLGLTISEVDDLLAGRRELTDDLAARVGQHLGTSAQMWINLRDGARPAVARTDGQPPADGLVTAARSVVDLVDRTVDLPGVVRDVVDNLRNALSADLPGAVREALARSAAPADDTAAPDRITAVRELLNAICDPMDQAEAESHLDILGVTRAEVDEAKRRTAARPVRDTPTSGEEPTDA